MEKHNNDENIYSLLTKRKWKNDGTTIRSALLTEDIATLQHYPKYMANKRRSEPPLIKWNIMKKKLYKR